VAPHHWLIARLSSLHPPAGQRPSSATLRVALDSVWAENADHPPMLLPLSLPPPGSIIKVVLTRIHTGEWNISLSVTFPNGYAETWNQNEPWTAAH